MAEALVPPGEVTWFRSSARCFPEFRANAAEPSTVDRTSCSATRREKPRWTAASTSASMSKKTYVGPVPETAVAMSTRSSSSTNTSSPSAPRMARAWDRCASSQAGVAHHTVMPRPTWAGVFGMDRTAHLAQHGGQDLRLDREDDDVARSRGVDVRAGGANAEAPSELVAPRGAGSGGDDGARLDEALLQQSTDHRLGHRAAADEGDRLRGERHAAQYAELHTHSNYSFLDGASHPEDLVDRALELGLEALALTDTNGLYGAVRFWQYAEERGLHAVLGTELKLVDGDHLVLLAKDNAGWTSLCRLISRGQLAGEKEEPRFTLDLVREHAEGVVCLTGCARGTVSKTVRAGEHRAAQRHLERLREIFAERLYVELEHHLDADDDLLIDGLAALADET